MDEPIKFTEPMVDNPGTAVLSFSLEGEINPGLRNKLRRALDRNDIFSAGTTLFEGVISLSQLKLLIEELLDIVRLDQSDATLTNLEVWFMGTQRYSLRPINKTAA